jgi:hypothetical protein
VSRRKSHLVVIAVEKPAAHVNSEYQRREFAILVSQ